MLNIPFIMPIFELSLDPYYFLIGSTAYRLETVTLETRADRLNCKKIVSVCCSAYIRVLVHLNDGNNASIYK